MLKGKKIMAHTEILDELWGVTTDNGNTFVDEDEQLCGIRLWLDGHNFYNSKAEADAFLQKLQGCYPNMKVVKLVFSVKISSR